MHDEAIRAAGNALYDAIPAPWHGDVDAIARAAITAFLERVEVSGGMRQRGERAVDHMPPNRDDEECVAFRAMLAQLRREL